jgi:voltage-gated potassium channel
MPALIAVLLSRLSRSYASRLATIGFGCLVIGAVLFSVTEHLGFGTALYWAVVTATTVGYGDVTPKTTAGHVVAIAVILTTIPLFASAFAIFAGAVAGAHLRRLLGVAERDTTDREVLIFGTHPSVARIAEELLRAGREVVVVAEVDRNALPERVRFLAGDPTSEQMVRRSQPERAAHLLVTGSSDADVLVTALLVRRVAPHVPTLAVAHSANVSAALRELRISTTISPDELFAHTLAKSLEAPHAGELLLRLVDPDGFQLKELPVEETSVGRRLSELRGERAGLVLGAVQGERVVFEVDRDPVLASGDRLLVLESEHS